MDWVIGIGVWVLIFVGIVAAARRRGQSVDGLLKGWTANLDAHQRGAVKGKMICPHCQTAGTVRTKRAKVKSGVSGGKATGAILTGGVSLLATGLSRKQQVTQASCSNCGAEWTF